MQTQRVWKEWQFPAFVTAVYLFLYVPVVILMIFSFNRGDSPTYWLGFTTDWYAELFSSSEVYDALTNSIIVAATSVVLSIFFECVLCFLWANEWLRILVALILFRVGGSRDCYSRRIAGYFLCFITSPWYYYAYSWAYIDGFGLCGAYYLRTLQ